MSKIFNLYTKDENGNDIDRIWYKSSNVKYSECVDNDNALKTLRVVFNNGTQYQYEKVNVTKYLMFRDADSQGKALNQYIKSEGYEYKKIEDSDLDELEKELNFRMEGGIFVIYKNGTLIIKDNKDVDKYNKEVELTKEAFDTICEVLNAFGKEISSVYEP